MIRPDLPATIAALPWDVARNAPVPWFVHRAPTWKPGDAIDFRIADADKRGIAYTRDLCWVCGRPLGLTRCVVVGPMCLVAGSSAEPQMHPGCAEWSACHCPFLSRPQMKRSPRPHEGEPAPGLAIERNPGVVLVGYTRARLELAETADGRYLFRLPRKWNRLVFLRAGLPATYDQVVDSIVSGVPTLVAVARDGGPKEMAALSTALDRALDLVAATLAPQEKRA